MKCVYDQTVLRLFPQLLSYSLWCVLLFSWSWEVKVNLLERHALLCVAQLSFLSWQLQCNYNGNTDFFDLQKRTNVSLVLSRGRSSSGSAETIIILCFSLPTQASVQLQFWRLIQGNQVDNNVWQDQECLHQCNLYIRQQWMRIQVSNASWGHYRVNSRLENHQRHTECFKSNTCRRNT